MFAADVAFNYESRNRFEESYYRANRERYETNIDSAVSSTFRATKDDRFPYRKNSLEKMAGSVNLYADFSSKIGFTLNNSFNNNYGIASLGNGLPIAQNTNQGFNTYLKGAVYNFGIQASYLTGTQGLTGKLDESKYNYTNTDLYLDYHHEFFNNKLSIRPAVAFQSASIDDRKYTIDKGKIGQFNGKGTLNNTSGSLKFDFKPINPLRIIAAVRYDRFNNPDKGFLSYQFIANYKLTEMHAFRAIYSRSYNGSFVVPTLVNSDNVIPSSNPFAPSTTLKIRGNDNLNLVLNTMVELGYRGLISKSVSIDIALFNQQFQNFNTLVLVNPGYDPVQNTINLPFIYSNLPLKVNQFGATIGLQSSFLDGKLQFKPHITFQQSNASNYSPYYNTKGAYDQPATPFSPAYTLSEG